MAGAARPMPSRRASPPPPRPRRRRPWARPGRATPPPPPRSPPPPRPAQREALGALWAANPSCLMQTHLSEQVDEVAWVHALYPEARDYLDTYEQAGLLGERGLYGHAIHLEPREVDRLAEMGASAVHCPPSNTFIGAGPFGPAGRRARE